MSDKIVLLQFTSSAAPYVVGDVAGFSEEAAAKLVKVKVARVITAEEAVALTTPKPARPEDEVVLFRFDKPRPPYVVGDIAGFSRAIAEEMTLADLGEITSPKYAKAAEPEKIERHSSDSGTGIAPVRTDLTMVRFTKAAHGYNQGDVAGFAAELADQFIEEGNAVLAAADSAPAAAGTPASPDPTKIDPNVEVVGLDDRDPEWREKATQQTGANTVATPAPASNNKKGGK